MKKVTLSIAAHVLASGKPVMMSTGEIIVMTKLPISIRKAAKLLAYKAYCFGSKRNEYYLRE